jgi:hypothetical protein
VIADLVTVLDGLPPAVDPVLDPVRIDVEGRLDPEPVEEGQADVDLAQTGIVEGQADRGALPFGPGKARPRGRGGKARQERDDPEADDEGQGAESHDGFSCGAFAGPRSFDPVPGRRLSMGWPYY